jgi:hypothetical protein
VSEQTSADVRPGIAARTRRAEGLAEWGEVEIRGVLVSDMRADRSTLAPIGARPGERRGAPPAHL